MNFRSVDRIIDRYEEKRTALISILHDIQGQYHHLPEEPLKRRSGHDFLARTRQGHESPFPWLGSPSE